MHRSSTMAAAVAGLLLITHAPARAAAPREGETAPQVAALLSRYEEWRGGAAFRRIGGLRMRGRLTTSGLTGTVEIVIAPPAGYRQDVDLGVVKQSVRVGPGGGWRSTLSGQVQELPASERLTTSSEGRLLLARPATETGWRLVGSERRGASALHVVRRQVGGEGAFLELLLDGQGALHASRSSRDGKRSTTSYSDWRVVDGVRFPFSERTEGAVPSDLAEVVYEGIELPSSIDAEVFARPSEVRRMTFGENGTSGWLPYEFFGGNRIFIPAVVGGHRTSVLLDSGAEATVLDRRFADAASLRIAGETTARGVGGTSTAGMIGPLDIEIGGARLTGLTVASIDLSGVESHLGHELPVVLGAEIFREAVVEIDFAGRRIAFHDPGRFEAPSKAVIVPVTASGAMYTVPATIDGVPAVLDMDLGSGSPLFLYPRFWDDRRKLERKSTTVIGGVGGVREAGLATLDRVEFGGMTFRQLPVELHPGEGENGVAGRSDGNLGLPLLARFHLYVDLSKNRILLVDPVDAETPFKRDRTGLSLLPQAGAAKVLHVGPGSPAAASGIRTGDVVTEVDGRPAGHTSNADWRSRPPGTRVSLCLSDGRTVRLVLADFF